MEIPFRCRQRHGVDHQFEKGPEHPCDQDMLQLRVNPRGGHPQAAQHVLVVVGGLDLHGHHLIHQIGVPGGVATLDADGKLSESQRPAVDAYTKAETDQRISAAVDAHNGAENAHSDIRASVAAMNASIKAIELKFGTNVTKNPFSATFGSLDGLTVTGTWDAEQARVEF